MEFNEKLYTLRKQIGLTQEQLANELFVSRTAVSKWEAGRGYPNIESLKKLAELFSITLDELLSNDELLCLAQQENKQTKKSFCSTMVGMLDIASVMLLFLPLFAQRTNGTVKDVSLLALSGITPYFKVICIILVAFMIFVGIVSLLQKNAYSAFLTKFCIKVSLALNTAAVILFIVCLQPYAAIFSFAFLIIKVLLLIKK